MNHNCPCSATLNDEPTTTFVGGKLRQVTKLHLSLNTFALAWVGLCKESDGRLRAATKRVCPPRTSSKRVNNNCSIHLATKSAHYNLWNAFSLPSRCQRMAPTAPDAAGNTVSRQQLGCERTNERSSATIAVALLKKAGQLNERISQRQLFVSRATPGQPCARSGSSSLRSLSLSLSLRRDPSTLAAIVDFINSLGFNQCH